jgi:acyl-coenzyme A thioesterase PaaI-like protein
MSIEDLGNDVGKLNVAEPRYEFDRATQIFRQQSPNGSVAYTTKVHPGWDIMGNANGGYLLALVGHALSDATGRPDCITINSHYLAPCPAGDARIVVTPVRSGRRFATATASLFLFTDTGEKEIIRVLATLGDLAHDPGGPSHMDEHATFPPKGLLPFDECVGMSDSLETTFAYIHGRLGTRANAGDVGFRNGAKSGQAMIRGWFAFNDNRPIDTRALLLASDAFPPSVFNIDLPVAWVPTVELTVHTRAIPAPGPVACIFSTRFVQNGLLEEDGEMWDSRGVLVAQSRQLALAPRQ